MSDDRVPLQVRLRFEYKLDSEKGGNFRGNQWARAAKDKKARHAVWAAWQGIRAGLRRKLTLPLHIIRTRIAPSKLDPDNCITGFKQIQDQLALMIGFNDRTDLVWWVTDQRRDPVPRTYAVEIDVIESSCGYCGKPFHGPFPGDAPMRTALPIAKGMYFNTTSSHFVHGRCIVNLARGDKPGVGVL